MRGKAIALAYFVAAALMFFTSTPPAPNVGGQLVGALYVFIFGGFAGASLARSR